MKKTKRIKKMKLFSKTFLFTMLLFCLMNLFIHLTIYYIYPRFYLSNVEKNLDEKMEILQGTLAELDEGGAGNVLYAFSRENNVNVTVEIGKRMKTYQGLPFKIEGPFRENTAFMLEGVGETESLIIRNCTAELKDKTAMNLQIMASTQPVKEATEIIVFLLPYTLGLAVVFSVVFAYTYSKRITKPIMEMLKVTADMKNLRQDAYFQVRSGDEIGMLADQINQVYGHLWQTIDSLDKEKRRSIELEKSKVDFLRSASHELKTPLSGLRILLENMRYNIGKYKDRDTYLESAIGTVDQLSEMVKEILDSSRIQGQAGEAPKEILEVKNEIEEVLKGYKMLAASKSLRIELRLDEQLQIEMNRRFFQRVWSNLIGNAVRYTDAGGCISIENSQSALSIRNTCTPLADEEIAHIFEAFYRPDFSRNAQTGGSGLGLYIVKEILDANGIPCKFEACKDGMCFTMG